MIKTRLQHRQLALRVVQQQVHRDAARLLDALDGTDGYTVHQRGGERMEFLAEVELDIENALGGDALAAHLRLLVKFAEQF